MFEAVFNLRLKRLNFLFLGDGTLTTTILHGDHTDLKNPLSSEWSVIPKSVTQARIEKNFELDGWDLSSAEMKKLDGLTDRFKVCQDGWLPIKVFHGDDE